MSKIAGELNMEMLKNSKVIHDSRLALFSEMVKKTGSHQSVLDCLMQEIESLRQQLSRCQMALADTEALELGTAERLIKREKQIMILRDALTFIALDDCFVHAATIAEEALAATPDLDGLILCEKATATYTYKHNSEFGDGTFWSHRPTHNGNTAIEAVPLYAPKGLKK